MTSLKDFPQWNPYASETDKRAFTNHVFEWREYFEKNQKDILEATWEWCEQNGLATDKTNVAILRAFIRKEILGE